MSEAIAGETLDLTETRSAPECYVRINIAKQAKGYVPETTVSMRWIDLVHPSRETGEPEGLWMRRPDAWGAPIDQPARLALDDLLRMADDAARQEIARREALDAEKAAVPS